MDLDSANNTTSTSLQKYSKTVEVKESHSPRRDKVSLSNNCVTKVRKMTSALEIATKSVNFNLSNKNQEDHSLLFKLFVKNL